MAVSTKTASGPIALRYAMSAGMIVAGLALNYLGIGASASGFIFGSVGNWLIYIGAVSAFVSAFAFFRKKGRMVDERMEKIGYKAHRLSISAFLLLAFLLMVVDGISPIALPYYLFISYMICAYLVLYFVAYKWVERAS